MSDIRIRCLEGRDLGFADELREIAGWNQLRPDWERYLGLEPEGCFLAEVDGEPAGTATTTCYGTDLAWIGMVLVHPDFRRQGVGTALLTHAIHHLRVERGIRCVKLDATTEGRPLYEKLGFQAEWGLRRWWRVAGNGGVLGEKRDLEISEGSLDLDRQVFGADRSLLLQSLGRSGLAVSERNDGSFGMSRDGARAVYVGPITAATDSSGNSIASELISQVPEGRWVFWDLPEANAAAVALAESLRFEPVRELTRMWLGEQTMASDPKRMWGISDFGLG